jgi:hypothetical protein
MDTGGAIVMRTVAGRQDVTGVVIIVGLTSNGVGIDGIAVTAGITVVVYVPSTTIELPRVPSLVDDDGTRLFLAGRPGFPGLQ